MGANQRSAQCLHKKENNVLLTTHRHLNAYAQDHTTNIFYYKE